MFHILRTQVLLDVGGEFSHPCTEVEIVCWCSHPESRQYKVLKMDKVGPCMLP